MTNYASLRVSPLQARKRRLERGMTVVETMIASVLLAMSILGILGCLISAYRTSAKARYRDHARYIIKSLADQFLTEQTQNTSDGSTITLFQVTAPTGQGIVWQNPDGSIATHTMSGSGPSQFDTGVSIVLGDNTGAPITASVTRQVQYLASATVGSTPAGSPVSTVSNQAAGYLLRGDFAITYTFLSQTITQSITVVRSVP